MNGTHEAHAMFATRLMRLQRVRLLGSANLVQWRLCYPCQLRSRTRTFFAVDDGDEFPLETTTSRSRTAGQSYPRAKPGSTRVHQGMCQCSPLWVHTRSYRKCLGRGHGLRLEGDGLVGGIRWEPPT